MKTSPLIFTLLSLFCLSLSLHAQQPTRTLTSTGGLTITYPEGYIPSTGQDPFALYLSNPTRTIIFSLLFGESAGRLLGETPRSASDAFELYANQLETYDIQVNLDETEQIIVSSGTLSMLPYTQLGFESALMYAVDLNSGGVVFGLIYSASPDAQRAMRGDVIQITNSLQLSGLSASTPTAPPVIVPTVTTAPSLTVTAPPTATPRTPTATPTPPITPTRRVGDRPEGTYLIADLPAGQVYFQGEFELTYPPEWQIFESDPPYIADSVVLIRDENPLRSAAFFVIERSRTMNETIVRDELIADVARRAGDMVYDPNLSLEIHRTRDGRVIEYYNSVPYVETGTLAFLYFIIPLDDTHFGTVQSGVRRDEVETILPELLTMIEGFQPRAAAGATPTATSTLPASPTITRTPSLTPPPTATMISAREATCTTIAGSLLLNTPPDSELVVRCPKECTQGIVWGTDIYTSDSTVCTAAIHAGVIPISGGLFILQGADGQPQYTGSSRNGVISSDWGSWGASFTVRPFQPTAQP